MVIYDSKEFIEKIFLPWICKQPPADLLLSILFKLCLFKIIVVLKDLNYDLKMSSLPNAQFIGPGRFEIAIDGASLKFNWMECNNLAFQMLSWF